MPTTHHELSDCKPAIPLGALISRHPRQSSALSYDRAENQIPEQKSMPVVPALLSEDGWVAAGPGLLQLDSSALIG